MRCCWLTLLLAALLPLVAKAEPFVPLHDGDIVQRLPYRVDASERARRAALVQDPLQLPVAIAEARQALERARIHGDPRELGVAEAALAPWWQQRDAPPEARLLRAHVLQSRHDFTTAQAELDRLLTDASLAPEVRAQALLDAAALHQLRAELPQARARCDELARLAPLPAAACQAELASLVPRRADAERAAQTLTQLAASQSRVGAGGLSLMRAELAERLGEERAAPSLYLQTIAAQDEVYARAAYADWLLARGRAADALNLVTRSADAEADALLLRRVIALRQLKRDAVEPAAQMSQRLATADKREPGKHAREQARFALDVTGDAREALRLAQVNWAMQREPTDAVLLLRTALAAGRSGDAVRQDLARFQREQGWHDARLTALDPAFTP